jgi:hypothetical protein
VVFQENDIPLYEEWVSRAQLKDDFFHYLFNPIIFIKNKPYGFLCTRQPL